MLPNQLDSIIGMTSAPDFLKGQRSLRTVVLLYHRVDNMMFDPQLAAVTPEHFSEHLQVISREFETAKFATLGTNSQNKLSRNKVIVTFDDGYYDNYSNAFPLLQQYEIPATIFVTTGAVQGEIDFWWDVLQTILFEAPNLPHYLKLQLDNLHEWDLTECSQQTGSANQEASGHENDENATVSFQKPVEDWNLLSKTDPTKKHEIYRTICSFLLTADSGKRADVIKQIKSWAPDVMPASSFTRALSPENIQELHRSGLVEIGSHAVTHPKLSTMTNEEQRKELRQSRDYLSEIIESEVRSFAYPYGTKSDYNLETKQIAAETGYSCAASNIAEVVWPGTDRFEIPRLLVRDCGGDYFSKWLREWFGN